MRDDFKDEWKGGLEGFDAIWGLREKLRGEIQKRYDRSLPFGDEFSDRWERAKYLGFGEGSSIYDSAIVMGDVRVGENTWVGPQTILDGQGGLRIGKFCSISAGTHIYSHDTLKWALTGGQQGMELSPTVIDDFCYIAPQCIISSGVHVGKQSILGANSFLKDDLPALTIAAGNPARIIGRVLVEGDEVTLEYHHEK